MTKPQRREKLKELCRLNPELVEVLTLELGAERANSHKMLTDAGATEAQLRWNSGYTAAVDFIEKLINDTGATR